VLAELAATQDELLAGLARAASLAALGQHAGLAAGMPSAIGPALAAAHGVVDGVHRLGPGVRANAHVAAAAGLADVHIAPFHVAQLSDRRPATGTHPAHLAAGKRHHGPLALAA